MVLVIVGVLAVMFVVAVVVLAGRPAQARPRRSDAYGWWYLGGSDGHHHDGGGWGGGDFGGGGGGGDGGG